MRRRRFKLVDVSPVSNEKTRYSSNAYSRFSEISSIRPVQDKSSAPDHEITCGEEKSNRPYLKDGIELIIPLDAPDRYRWWAGGQSIFDTLLELDAPEALIECHIGEVGSPKNWRRWQRIRNSRAGGQVGEDFGNLSSDFDKNEKDETL